MILTRNNSQGVVYSLESVGEKTTITRTGGKSLVVDADLESLNQSWYNWQMGGQYIQNAFPQLTAEEREFILSGTTAGEWREMFPKEE